MKIADKLYYYSEYGMLDCNTYLIKDDTTVIIDPGNEAFVNQLTRDIESDDIDPEGINLIANTHLHLDHCMADRYLKSISEAKIGLHNLQREYKDVALRKVSGFFGTGAPRLTEDIELNSSLNTGQLEVLLIPTPGHSPDSICFYCQNGGFLICGDLIFKRSTGRVDLPGGDRTKLKESIDQVANLEYDKLLPGHMDIIRGREQIEKNFDYIREFVLDMF